MRKISEISVYKDTQTSQSQRGSQGKVLTYYLLKSKGSRNVIKRTTSIQSWEFVEDECYTPLSFDEDLYHNRVLRKKNFLGRFKPLKYPIEFFNLFLNENIFQSIANFTNEKARRFYSGQQPNEEGENEDEEISDSMIIETQNLTEIEYSNESPLNLENPEMEEEEEAPHKKEWQDVTKAEIKAFNALLLQMWVTKAPNLKFYWKKIQNFEFQELQK